ncbi:MAG: primosomal protein N' [Candidatus Omnitrophica bacterium]|nr:primosomal protein N' [Candidatus Omnitrophota bacterium]
MPSICSLKMYAQVVFNLPIEGRFDYFVPPAWEQKLRPGVRTEVFFGKRRCFGYIVGKAEETEYKKVNPVRKGAPNKIGLSNGVKPILRILDDIPILDKTMLKITRRVSEYYACSWGEAIEAAVPKSLRKGRRIDYNPRQEKFPKTDKASEVMLLQDIKGQGRWEIYLREINDNLNKNRGIIFLTPDKEQAGLIQKEIKERLNVGVGLLHSNQSVGEELRQWIEMKKGLLRIVVGTRLAVFAPLVNLGLVIIEEEQSSVYKQDSRPHYHAVGVAKIRTKIEGARLILFSRSPSLETWYQAKRNRIKYILKDIRIPARQIKIVDLQRVGFIPQKRKIRLSISLEDALNKTLNQKGRAVLFLNRRGFAIFSYCQNCGKVLRCPRCNANLILHFKNDTLTCHRCNYRTQSPTICPSCNSGYIRYSGLGTEKLESELHRLYPGVNIARLDKEEKIIPNDAQLIVATESVLKHRIANLDLIGVLSPDTALNRPDFRAGEKVFALLLQLACLTSNCLIIQTKFPKHYCFRALTEKRINLFYETELVFRRQSHLPPFNHIIMVKLRGRKEERVSLAAGELFDILNNCNKNKSIKIVSCFNQIPHKKRDNFHEQILITTRSVIKAVNFLKKILADFRRSGIIITVDVDPV